MKKDTVSQKVQVTFPIYAAPTRSAFAPGSRILLISHHRVISCGIFLQMLPLVHTSLSAVVCPHFTHHLNVSDSFAGNNGLWRRRRNYTISGEPNCYFVVDSSSVHRIIKHTEELESDMFYINILVTSVQWETQSSRHSTETNVDKILPSVLNYLVPVRIEGERRWEETGGAR